MKVKGKGKKVKGRMGRMGRTGRIKEGKGREGKSGKKPIVTKFYFIHKATVLMKVCVVFYIQSFLTNAHFTRFLI
jgi:hypothetical protein